MATFALMTTVGSQPRPARSTSGVPGRAANRQAFASLSYPTDRQVVRNPHVGRPGFLVSTSTRPRTAVRRGRHAGLLLINVLPKTLRTIPTYSVRPQRHVLVSPHRAAGAKQSGGNHRARRGTLLEHLVVDAHHADWAGQKGYIPTTVGSRCILGVALTAWADDVYLQEAYGCCGRSAGRPPEYAPQTVNTDGWASTQNAFQTLFPLITVVLCFLHGFLKIRDRCRKARELHRRVWDVYCAALRRSSTSDERV